MPITASELRRDVYRLLDRALETGEAIEIERGGRRLRIVPDEVRSHWEGLEPHPALAEVDLDGIEDVHFDDEWQPDGGAAEPAGSAS